MMNMRELWLHAAAAWRRKKWCQSNWKTEAVLSMSVGENLMWGISSIGMGIWEDKRPWWGNSEVSNTRKPYTSELVGESGIARAGSLGATGAIACHASWELSYGGMQSLPEMLVYREREGKTSWPFSSPTLSSLASDWQNSFEISWCGNLGNTQVLAPLSYRMSRSKVKMALRREARTAQEQ